MSFYKPRIGRTSPSGHPIHPGPGDHEASVSSVDFPQPLGPSLSDATPAADVGWLRDYLRSQDNGETVAQPDGICIRDLGVVSTRESISGCCSWALSENDELADPWLS